MPRDPDDPDPPKSEGSGSPSSEGSDSFMRQAAEISEPSPAAIAGRRSARVDLAAGQVIGKRYRLDQELGRGGMGVVWSATHLVTRRRVAIKFLLGRVDDRDELRRRFLREARAASSVEHPNVVEVMDVFELEDETPVIVMELLSGETLRARLEREGKLSLAQASAILLRVLDAAATAHASGVVHRDLKPDNIFLSQHGTRGEVVKVVDFGIAKLVSGGGHASEVGPITATGSVIGTPCYMAPEQTMGEKDIDHQADIWAIGVILYECLAGVRPLQGSSIGQVVRELAVEGIRPLDHVEPGLPREVTALVMRMLERERKDRTKDVREAQEVLERFAARSDTLPSAPDVIAHRTPAEARSPRNSAQTPVDTEGAQSLPNGVRQAPRRSIIVGLAVAALAGIALGSWRLGSSGAQGTAASASAAASERSPAVASLASAAAPFAPPSMLAEPVVAAQTAASYVPPEQSQDAGRGLHAAGGTVGHPKPATAAAVATASKPAAEPLPPPPAAPSIAPRPAPGGLAEKPPF